MSALGNARDGSTPLVASTADVGRYGVVFEELGPVPGAVAAREVVGCALGNEVVQVFQDAKLGPSLEVPEEEDGIPLILEDHPDHISRP